MVEVDVIGRLVDADPRNGLAVFPGLADRLELRTLRLDLGVAIHAGLGGGNVGVGGFFHVGVAVAAVHAQLVDVQGMVEGHRLGGLITDAKLIEDPSLRQAMSKEARATAEKYAPGNVAELYVQAFENLLRG